MRVAQDLEGSKGSTCVVAHDVHVWSPIEFLVEEEAKILDYGLGADAVV